MKNYFLIIILLILVNCNKQKTVLICGDHECVNKTEAKQYFEENLSIEVKIINKKKNKDFDLVELNLKEDFKGTKAININSKRNTNEEVKILTNKEIENIKQTVKIKEKQKKIVKKSKKVIKNDVSDKILDNKATSIREKSINEIASNNSININQDVFDVCTVLKKCNIDEISKFLLKQGDEKGFPDITRK